jgi:hypothetical protein
MEKRPDMAKLNEAIHRCNNCGLHIISEELSDHECRELKDVWAFDGRIWIGDGIQYYPLKSPTNLNNQNKHPDNEQNHYQVLKTNTR